ncbi:hypothetical protein Q4I30_007300 [Leishmania utingensis]|uniref:Uncharacterized protein n=1 Tax=Leishmania utingensis TaxID=653362 RepID=A0AAW2ZY39_9TRYP
MQPPQAVIVAAAASSAAEDRKEREEGAKKGGSRTEPTAPKGMAVAANDKSKKVSGGSTPQLSSEPTATADAQEWFLGIPAADASSVGASTRRSFNSRSSSASRRLVCLRPAKVMDVTIRSLDSPSNNADDDSEDEGRITVGRSTSNVRGRMAVITTEIPAAIFPSPSLLSDTTTSAGRSDVQ